MASPGGGGGGRGFGPPPPPAKPAGGMAGDQTDGTAPPLHGSASASAASTAPPLHGSASGYVGAGVIRPQMRGAAGAGSREVNTNAAAMPVRPVTLAAHGNHGTDTGVQVHASTQRAQGVRISNVAHAPPNPPGRHDPSRVVMSQAQTGAGSSTSATVGGAQLLTGAGSSTSAPVGGAQLLAQAIHSQTLLVCRTVVEGIEHIARSGQWNTLEGYLSQIIAMSGSSVDLHPRLLLYCRRGWLIRLLQSGLRSLAIRFHQGYIAPLRHLDSQFADPDEMRSQLDVIWGSITRDPSYTELLASHPHNIVDLIMDYMRLHFPEVVGHTNPTGTTNQLWAFGVHIGRESKKAKLRCILWQHELTTDRVGVDMGKHLRESCPKMTPHWRAKSKKKRPRSAATKQAGLSQVTLPSWKMLISTEANEGIGTLALLRLNEGARYHATILGGELQAIAQLGNEPFFLAGRLEAAVSALHDLMATFMLEGEKASSALKELTVRLYKLQFLIPICLLHMQGSAPTQMVQNQALTVSGSQQQPVAVPSTQQQPVVVAPSAVPQEQVVIAPSAGDQEQVVVPLVEEQVAVEDQVNDVNGQNVEEHHAGQGDDPFNILTEPAELDQVLQFANQFLGAGQGDPPPPV